MSRGPSPLPPLPPKDRPQSAFTAASTVYLTPSTHSGHLADALRDSVHIRSSREDVNNQDAGAQTTSYRSLDPNTRSSILQPRRTPSPSFQPTHHHSQSSPDMASIAQPNLPSTQMRLANRNPFEDDEVEPVGSGRVKPPPVGKGSWGPEGTGTVPSTRQSFNRSMTGNTTSTSSSANLLEPVAGGKTRIRRSLSSDSYGLEGAPKELTAGQKKALEDKKGSRHADVIDTLDPTGMGSASDVASVSYGSRDLFLQYSSGPYDAAAPSRNVNLPPTKAPMQAFDRVPVTSPPRTATTISLASPPLPPPKSESKGPSKTQQGRHAAPRRISGGLGGQYSTSMPSSGGYFPDAVSEEPMDEAAMARKDRQKERENKRRALKAAWGTDTPEPFEDFGASPSEGVIDSTSAPLPGKPMRSPGLRLGLGPRTPPIYPDGPTSPDGESAPPVSRSGNFNGGGVKRTKSLMQKIKSMVRQRSGSVESAPVVPVVRPVEGRRSHSISTGLGQTHSPTWLDRDVMEEELVEGEDQYQDADESHPGEWGGASLANRQTSSLTCHLDLSLPQRDHPNNPLGGQVPRSASPYSPSNESPPTQSPSEDAPRRNPFFGKSSGRLSPQKQETLSEEPIDYSVADGNGFVLVESPNSKARAIRALRKEQETANQPLRRDKSLPPPPPVAPVLPDFEDLSATRSRTYPEASYQDGSGGIRRKPSMVKKLREKMASK
ncbi:hypothetical protein P7C73_g3737, partial [Tremellales sp. Uapishka_1]